MLKLTLSAKPITINLQVQCLYRAACYKNLLESFLSDIYAELGQSLILSQAVIHPGLVESLAELLDEQVIYYIEKDLMRYNKGKSKNYSENIDLDKVKQLADYYKHCAENLNHDYGAYLKQLFPQMELLLNRLTHNFKESIIKALKRIQDDWPHLIKLFLNKSNPENYELIKLVITDSDRHKKGQQVLILEIGEGGLKAANNNASISSGPNLHRIVYKPASVLIDMMMQGDITRLRERGHGNILPYLENAQSLVEIINECLDDTADALTATYLPTYLIYPREQDNIAESYGYLEYLSHEPWLDTSIKKAILLEIDARLNKNPINEINFTKTIDKIVEIQKERLLEKAKKLALEEQTGDYIITSRQELKRFSRQCGMLVAMAVIFNISDANYENLIVSKKAPYRIDYEVAFTFKRLSVESAGFFDDQTGAMAYKKFRKTARFLFDINGFKEADYDLLDKYQFYFLNEKGEREKCPLLKDDFLKGFEQLFAVVYSPVNQNKFLDWFDHTLTKHMTIRILPLSTQDFLCYLEYMREIDFNTDQFQQQIISRINEPQPIFLNIGKFEHADTIHFSESVYNDIYNFNVPVFYMPVSDKRLRDSTGKIMMTDYLMVANALKRFSSAAYVPEVLPDNTALCFETPPLEYVKNQFIALSNNIEWREKIIKEAVAKCASYLNKQPDTYSKSGVIDSGNNGTPLAQEKQPEFTGGCNPFCRIM